MSLAGRLTDVESPEFLGQALLPRASVCFPICRMGSSHVTFLRFLPVLTLRKLARRWREGPALAPKPQLQSWETRGCCTSLCRESGVLLSPLSRHSASTPRGGKKRPWLPGGLNMLSPPSGSHFPPTLHTGSQPPDGAGEAANHCWRGGGP